MESIRPPVLFLSQKGLLHFSKNVLPYATTEEPNMTNPIMAINNRSTITVTINHLLIHNTSFYIYMFVFYKYSSICLISPFFLKQLDFSADKEPDR